MKTHLQHYSLFALAMVGISNDSGAQSERVGAADRPGQGYGGGFNSTGSSSGSSAGSLQQRQQYWQRQWESEQAQQAQKFQQQQQAIQTLGNGISTILQGVFSSPTTTYDDDADDQETYTRPSYGRTGPRRSDPYVPPAGSYSPPPAPARAQPLFGESLGSFIGSGASGQPAVSSAASAQGSLSSYFGSGGNADPRYQSSPEMDRFVKADIDWQHAYFDALAQNGSQSGQSASSWQYWSPSPESGEASGSRNEVLQNKDVQSAMARGKEIAASTGDALLETAEKRWKDGNSLNPGAISKDAWESTSDDFFKGTWTLDAAKEAYRDWRKAGMTKEQRLDAEENDLASDLRDAWSSGSFTKVKNAFRDGLDLIKQRADETTDILRQSGK